MATAISKRQQARNERALQDMTKTVPGNDRCADCATKNPSWASWNLGIFLCMRCAALHRKLGTHVSKVKSLSMDSWSVEQVENMRKMGNVNSNRQLNPQNATPQIPVDVDEVDAAIEKYIRQKYEQHAFMPGSRSAPTTRQNTGSTRTSFGDEPPPLPPKPGRQWGFLRSASSTIPKSKYEAPISSAYTVEERGSKSKAGHLFGMRITSVGNNFDQKLNMLKEMGFPDAKQNTDILKNTDGNLDRAVEILSRLNDAGLSELAPRPLPKTGFNGLTMSKTRQAPQADENIWEVKASKRSATAPLPQIPVEERSQSTEQTNAWNPFVQPDPSQAMAGAFQNMHVSQPAPLQTTHNFIPGQQPLSVQTTGNPWGMYMQPQHAMSVPAIPQPWNQGSPIHPGYTTNPFLQSTASPNSMTSSNPWSQQMNSQAGTPATAHSNPFGLPGVESTAVQPPQGVQDQSNAQAYALNTQVYQTTPMQNSPFNSQQSQQQYGIPAQNSPFSATTQAQSFYANPPQLSQSPAPYLTPLPQSQSVTPVSAASPNPFQQQMAGYPQQAANRHDKSSIMALYHYPQIAPQRQLQTLPEDSVTAPITPQPQQPAYSSGSMNPFAQQQNTIATHVSRESRDFQGMVQDGRHSPDAFAGLSSRFAR
ncbi:hypothetical protein AMS68_005776 [Peltaster fructicola]|uniref:Arf-GAP domain-containing protein n=1 Tax=Peltaster fructicola TaxID=286661 RepID=A0A6H0Y064_9PEZI|nr:hypothetical protein AMS68_005776 [Peltaster fructicola]